jgi:hypothetical protein
MTLVGLHFQLSINISLLNSDRYTVGLAISDLTGEVVLSYFSSSSPVSVTLAFFTLLGVVFTDYFLLGVASALRA